jgi:hypothetical protein
MIFLKMILQMAALILKELGLLNQVMVLRTIRPLLLPAGNIKLVLALIVGPNLKVLVQTALPAHL